MYQQRIRVFDVLEAASPFLLQPLLLTDFSPLCSLNMDEIGIEIRKEVSCK